MQAMKRREFFGFLTKSAAGAYLARVALGAGLGATATIGMSGCNLEQDIINWVPTGEAALNSILAVLSANGILVPPGATAIVALIETAFNDLIAAAKEYLAITPPPVGALAKIQAAFQAITDQFGNFVTSISGVAGKILTVVISLAKVIISTIGGFVSQLPTPAAAMAKLSSSNATVMVPPVHRTRRAFKKDFNAQLSAAATQGVNCPASAYLPLSLLEHL